MLSLRDSTALYIGMLVLACLAREVLALPGRPRSTIHDALDSVFCALQSFLTLYASAAKELVGLLGQCPQADPTLEDPHGAFITPAELRIQRLVRPTALPLLL